MNVFQRISRGRKEEVNSAVRRSTYRIDRFRSSNLDLRRHQVTSSRKSLHTHQSRHTIYSGEGYYSIAGIIHKNILNFTQITAHISICKFPPTFTALIYRPYLPPIYVKEKLVPQTNFLPHFAMFHF